MTTPSTITVWIERLKSGGDGAATERLWHAYFARLVALARSHLRLLQTRAVDEEDVALSAFDSFCRRAAQGQFPRLDDRDDLWQLLLVITARKAKNLLKHERRQKRGGGVAPVSSLAEEDADVMAEVLGREPTPEVAAQTAEQLQRLLDMLGDAELQTVATARMEGHTNEEVATQLGRSLATVERKLSLIRKIWQRELGVQEADT